MRPRGDIRSIFSETAARMVEPGGGVTWRAVAEETQIGFDIARATMENMVRSGEWERVGSEKPAGSNNWRGLYAPREPGFHLVSFQHPITGVVQEVRMAWPAAYVSESA